MSIRKLSLCIDPDIPSVTPITDITQTSVTISWSVGQTQVVNDTLVYYRATESTRWTSVSVTGTTHTHTVSSLQPGTRYQFYVKVNSYGKTSTSANSTATTGMTSNHICFVLRHCMNNLIQLIGYFRRMRRSHDEHGVLNKYFSFPKHLITI